jgi:hypothetical protein
MKTLFAALLIYFSGFFASHNTPAKLIVTPTPTITLAPTMPVTPTVTAVPTLTETKYLDEIVTLHNCQTGMPLEVKRSDLPKYGHPVNYIPGSLSACHPQQIVNNNEDSTIPPSSTSVYNAVPTQAPIKNLSCYQSGNYTYCNDGTSYRTEQNSGSSNSYTTYGSNGSMSQTNGNFTSGTGGSAIRSGNYSYGSDGSTCSRIGNMINCSGGN